jgi:hypothetical protein
VFRCLSGASPSVARVLSIIASNPLSAEFLNAVSILHPEIAYAYQSIIKRPIDLCKITHRALKGSYNGSSGNRRFHRNIRRLFLNAEAFNAFNPLITNLAGHLRYHAEGLWKAAAPFDSLVEGENGHNVNSAWMDILSQVKLSQKYVGEIISLLDELIRLGGNKVLKFLLPHKLLLSDSIKCKPGGSVAVTNDDEHDNDNGDTLPLSQASSEDGEKISSPITEFKFMEIMQYIANQLLLLEEEEDDEDDDDENDGDLRKDKHLSSRELSSLFASRMEELGMMMAEIVTRGCNRSSIWAAAEGIYWAVPPGAKASGQWPALIIAGENVNHVISAINITRIPEHILKVLRNKAKGQTLVIMDMNIFPFQYILHKKSTRTNLLSFSYHHHHHHLSSFFLSIFFKLFGVFYTYT